MLLALIFLAVFLSPLLETIAVLTGKPPSPTLAVTRGFLYLNMAFAVLSLFILPVLYLTLVRPGWSLTREFGLQWSLRVPLYTVLGILVTFALAFLLGLALSALREAGVFEEDPSQVLPQIQSALDWRLLVLLPLVSGLTEEVFFRGFLQPRLGLLPASLLFGLVHIGYGTILQVVAPVILGLLFGALYQRTRTLWAPIAAHSSFNFFQLLLLYYDVA